MLTRLAAPRLPPFAKNAKDRAPHVSVMPARSKARATRPNADKRAHLDRQQDSKSDIDVLIVGSAKPDQLELAMRKFERQFQREINYTLLGEPEFKKKLSCNDPFLADIWHGKKIKLLAA